MPIYLAHHLLNQDLQLVACIEQESDHWLATRQRVVDIETEEVLFDGVVENDSWRFLVDKSFSQNKNLILHSSRVGVL